MLRQWIVAYKPLQRVQEDLDRIEPVAQSLYEAAVGLYRGGQLEQAVVLLEQALGLNPNHLAANQLLADLYLSQEELDKAQVLLERLNDYQPAVARPRFVQVLLLQAQKAKSEDERLALYDRVLDQDSDQSEARAGKQRIWEQRGDAAQQRGDLEAALNAYREAGLKEKAAETEEAIRLQELEEKKDELEQLEEEENFEQALVLVLVLADQYPDAEDWTVYLDRLQEQIDLAELYQRAMGAVQSEDWPQVQSLLADVIARKPTYKEAARYLYQSVSGVDIEELQEEVRSLKRQLKARDKALAEAKRPSQSHVVTQEKKPVATQEKKPSTDQSDKIKTYQLPGGAELKMVWIEPGSFMMGSPESETGRDNDEGPQHEVTISRGFLLGQYEITQSQWEAVMETNPWEKKSLVQSNPDHPAVHISWEDVQKFIVRLNKTEGSQVFRLPTEAEWEYACRAGKKTRWSFGNDESQLGDYAWYSANTKEAKELYAHAVTAKLANPWGLYDMHGNIYEWCQDWFGSYSKDTQTDPTGPDTGSGRVVRGGSFDGPAQFLRSAARHYYAPGFRGSLVGVRLLRTSL